MWQILIHPLVLQEDLKKISPGDRKKIFKAISKKLTKDPKAYGKALTGPLKNYWRLQVGDFRVIYSVLEKHVVVKVIKVGIRRDDAVYAEMIKRLPKILDF